MSLKPLRQRIEAAAALAAYGLVRLLPVSVASGALGAVLRAIGPRLKPSRIARANLRRAFPDRDEAWVERTLAGAWENLGRIAGEFPHLHAIARDRVELVGAENIEAMRDDGQCGIYFSAHLANWEICAAVSRSRGLPVHLIYREANNPWIDRLYRRARGGSSGGLVPKGAHGARQALELLKKGEHLGMLMDQKMNDGIPVPFFGRDAMTAPALAQFALKYRCPVVPARVVRLPGARFRVIVYPAIPLPDTGDRHQDIRLLMTQVNEIMEGWIREHPDQWLWVHKRWPDS